MNEEFIPSNPLELWSNIKGYEGLYKINGLGQVKSNKCILKPHLKNGYLAVNLYDINGKCKHHYIHRLVAETFIFNSRGVNYVNHKDGDKLNNSVPNLEWCTQHENIKHSWEKGLQTRRYQTIVDNRVYPTMIEASFSEFNKTYNIINLLYHRLGCEFTYKGKKVKVVIPNV